MGRVAVIASAILLVVLAVSLTPDTEDRPATHGEEKSGQPTSTADKSDSPAQRSGHADWTRDVKPASGDGQEAIQLIDVPESFDVSLFAAEPMLANPVGMSVTPKGDVYIAEAFRRLGGGVEDNRDHTYWIDDDLASMSVEDRRAYYLKHHPEAAEKWTVADDRVRLIRDTNGDGVADESTVYADGFNDLVDGIGADVLAWNGDVYFTCIPHLWRLRDTDGDGIAEKRESLHEGFGCRTALFGHDLHGLVVGPDGRLYFSIGDRGYNITTHEGDHLFDPGRGAVFRCELDGSNLELFATGLRNPQDLTFDDYGNLFTVDNNSDNVDRARIVYIIEGAEIGWRMSFQYLSRRGPFVEEDWWRPQHPDQAAFLIPPIANLGSGPSGVACEPGTALGEKYRGWFLFCDFLGTRKKSGIRAFKLGESGAGFELLEDEWLAQGYLPTDCEFGADGTLWSSDWVFGWSGVGKGRIYRMVDKAAEELRRSARTAEHLRADLGTYDSKRLVELLGHADRRVRTRAQFALVERSALAELRRTALSSPDLLAALHGLWGCAQLERRAPGALDGLAVLLDGRRPAELTAQACKVFGDARRSDGFRPVRDILRSSDSPRVRAFAATALGKLADPRALDALFATLRQNADQDVFLRHACVMGLAGIGNVQALRARTASTSSSERLGAALALRRLKSPAVADFLTDGHAEVSKAAARAIYDLPIPRALPALADRCRDAGAPEPLLQRAVAACDKIGDASMLASVAADEAFPESVRVKALIALERFSGERCRDLVLGESQHAPDRDPSDAKNALAPVAESLLQGDRTNVVMHAARAAARHELAPTAALAAAVGRESLGVDARIACLRALEQLGADEVKSAIEVALRSNQPALRGAAADTLVDVDRDTAIEVLTAAVEGEKLLERKLAIDTLARMKDERADRLLRSQGHKLLVSSAPAVTHLEIVEALRARAEDGAVGFAELLEGYEKRVAEEGDLRRHFACLEGGSAERGERVFVKTEAGCARCHALKATTETMAGPMLGDAALRLDRRALLQSIVNPNAVIAEGFESVRISTAERSYHGRILEEDAERVVIQFDEGGATQTATLAPSEITGRAAAGSAMPSDIPEHLSARELRDLVEFLMTQTKSN